MRCLLLSLLGLLATGAALARPPPNADPALHTWYDGLRVPHSRMSCCSVSDCRTVEYRTRGDHYEAFVEGRWISIPPDKILQRTDNPTGHAVLCWTPALGVMCFVRGPET